MSTQDPPGKGIPQINKDPEDPEGIKLICSDELEDKRKRRKSQEEFSLLMKDTDENP